MKLCTPTQIDWSCVPDDQFNDFDPDKRSIAEQLAWAAFSALTAYQVAACPIELRPARSGCASSSWYEATVPGGGNSSFLPYMWGGRWYNATCGCSSSCGHDSATTLKLPGTVGGIDKIMVGTQTILASAYRIDNGNLLVRTDGGTWPFDQNLSLEPGTEGTFVVYVYEGAMPTAIDLFAVGRLAFEFYKDMCGDDCALPTSARVVNRQGIEYEVNANMFKDGITNISAVDAVIAMRNPHHLKTPSRVINPQARRSRVTTRRFY